MAQYTQDLPDEFFASVRAISDRLDPTNPFLADWLITMMQSESGIDPSVGNKAGASYFGLVQLGKPGFAPMTAEDFVKLSAVDQLPYVERFYKGAPIKSMRSAGNLYQYNFLPSSLSRGVSADTVIAAKDGTGYVFADTQGGTPYSHEPNFYTQNSALDTDRNGAITVADLDAKLASVAKNARVREAVNRLPPPVGGYPAIPGAKLPVSSGRPSDSGDSPSSPSSSEPVGSNTKKYIGAGVFFGLSAYIAHEKGWL
jgi:hypothetical protein